MDGFHGDVAQDYLVSMFDPDGCIKPRSVRPVWTTFISDIDLRPRSVGEFQGSGWIVGINMRLHRCTDVHAVLCSHVKINMNVAAWVYDDSAIMFLAANEITALGQIGVINIFK